MADAWLRSMLWRRSGDMRRATETAAGIGRVFGWLLIVLGVLDTVSGEPTGLWLAVIGFFIVNAAGAQAIGAEIRSVFAGVTAAKLMVSPVVSIGGDMSVAAASVDYFARYGYTAFPVVDADSRLLGLVTVDRVEALSHRAPPGHAGGRHRRRRSESGCHRGR